MGSVCFLWIRMVVAFFHKVGLLPEIQMLLYIFRRYFRDTVRVFWGGCSEFHLDLWLRYWIWILSFWVQIGWRVGYSFQYCQGLILCNQFDYIVFSCGFCISLRDVFYWSADVFTLYFIHKVPNYFWIGIRGYFWSEGSPKGSFGFFNGTSSFCFCSLLFFIFSDHVFIFNFLRVAWHSHIILLHSSVNHVLLWFGG